MNSLSTNLVFNDYNDWANITMVDSKGKAYKTSFKNREVLPFNVPDKGFAYIHIKELVKEPFELLYNDIKKHAEKNWFGEHDIVEYSYPWNENGEIGLKWPLKYNSGTSDFEMLEKHSKKERTQVDLQRFAELSKDGKMNITGTCTVKPWVKKEADKLRFGVTFVLDKSFI